jgi:hypothetical protein
MWHNGNAVIQIVEALVPGSPPAGYWSASHKTAVVLKKVLQGFLTRRLKR